MDFRLSKAIPVLGLLALLPELAGRVQAQEPLPRTNIRIDLAAGTGSDRVTGALSFAHQFAVALDRRLRIGYGMRYSVFHGSDLRLRTADRDELNGNPTDHARIQDPTVHAVNLAAHFSVRPLRRVELGFNIDVIGFGFGPEKLLDQEAPGEPSLPGTPAGFNLLRGGVRDLGTLDSEFYLGWQLARRILLRAGLSHYVAEYETKVPLAGGSTRLRVDGNLWFASLGYGF